MICFKLKTGESLHSYCKKNGYSYQTIFRNLDRKGLTVEEAIKLYFDRKGRKDFTTKYFYKGKKLTEIFPYGTSKYDKCIRKICNEKYSVEEAVEFCMNYVGRTNGYKHWYKGVPLIKYCKEHNISYPRVMGVLRLKKKTIEEIMRKYEK